MGSINKVILVGNLTRNPELRHTTNKKAVCVMGLATNRNWITESGEKHEEPEYRRLVAFDKLAEVCYQYLKKGERSTLRGGYKPRSYTGQDTVEKYATEIVLEKMEMLDSMPHDVKETVNGATAQHVQ
jgi:single-strand DNA-binding protein